MVFKRYKTRLKGLLLAVLIGLAAGMLHSSSISASSAEPVLFEAVWETVNENFYDPNFNGADWAALGERYRPQVAQVSSHREKAALINDMLAELNTSHTHFYTTDEPAYYQLLSIFYPRIPDFKTQLEDTFPEGKIEYTGIGAVTYKTAAGNTKGEKQEKTFIKAIFDGSPAAEAGLKVGDQILSAGGQPFHPIQSFMDNAEQPVSLVVQPSPNANSQKEITVTPKVYDGITMFLEAMDNSIDVVEKAGKKIGYVHIWSYAGEQYQEKLEDELLYGRLKDTDALVLDLRDGWGGAPLSALNLFTARGPSLTSIGRDRDPYIQRSHWAKPVVMLVNEGSRSGKEILAYGFEQYDIGPVVGSPTAGFVTGGRPFIMPNNSLLYVAVADVYLDETVRLEGVGVTPDVEVPFPIEYAQGVDPQKERAIATAIDITQK